jgi:hypothetical protein
VTRSAVRLSHRQLRRLGELDDETLPIAEVHRRFAREATARGLPRPSYECTRRLVNELRALRRRRVRTRDVLLEVAYRTRPVDALLDHVAGVELAPLDRS